MSASHDLPGQPSYRDALPPARPPDCLKCSHYFVTWDTAFPRGCRTFEIKSRQMPALEVLQATGKNCPAFELSPRVRT